MTEVPGKKTIIVDGFMDQHKRRATNFLELGIKLPSLLLLLSAVDLAKKRKSGV